VLPGKQLILFQCDRSNGVVGQHLPLDLTEGGAQIADMNFPTRFAADDRFTWNMNKN
jgi:hypothetical protein